jgi:uncharacterized delta-60 repeat protein
MKKILLWSILFSAIQINAQEGALDTTFGVGGKVTTSFNSGADKAYGVALQSDGKIVVAGYSYSSVFGNDFACARYNTNGTLDTTFGTNGIKTYDLQLGSDDKAYSVDIQLDGKIVLAGYSDNGSDKAGAVIRLNTNGSLDTTFDTDGIAITNFTIYNTNARADEYKAVKVHQVTGNIVVGGTSVLNTDESKGIFARYTSTGALDTTFGTGGKLIDLPFPESNANGYTFVIEDIRLKSNGKITAVGWSDIPSSYSRQYVCRLNANGTLDTTFSTDGFASNSFTTSDNKTTSLVLNADDSFLFSGSSRWSATDYKHYYGTVSAAGTVSVQGSVDFSSNTIDMCYGMAIDGASKIVLAGSAINSTATTSTFALSRINSDYTIDTTFGTAGKTTTTFGTAAENEAFDMVIQPNDEKIILVGYSGNDFAIARYIGNINMSVTNHDNNTVGLYPIPAKETITLNPSQAFEPNTAFTIYDVNGRTIKNGLLNGENNSISVEGMAKGLYFLKIIGFEQALKFTKE